MKMSRKRVILVAVCIGLILSIAVIVSKLYPGEPSQSNGVENIESLAIRYAVRMAGKAFPRILVIKSRRVLIYYKNEENWKAFRVGLGFNPEGHKQREGDGRTPEGEYYICTKNPQSKYYFSMGISYPGIADARRGLEKGMITKEQHDKIVSAVEMKRCPSWYTPLGGEVCFHGRGAHKDWTLGCVALDDKDMKYLYDNAKLQTLVVIVP
jgi:murein L,D-transpeptidase YafK